MGFDLHMSEPLGEVIRTLHAAMSAVRSQLLVAIASADDPGFYGQDGAASLADWLQMFLKISRRTALDWTRAATALESLPVVAEAHATGRVSFDQVRALTRYTTSETETVNLETAQETTIAGLEAIARARVPVTEEQARRERRLRSLSMVWSEEKTSLRFRGRLPADEGVLFETAIVSPASKAAVKDADGTWPDPQDSYADALVELASTRLADKQFSAVPTVVLHIDAEVLEGRRAGNAVYEEGQLAGQSLIERLTCDCQWVACVERDGQTIGIGKRSRQVPWWLRTLILDRDGGCRWPGCRRTRWLHCHHIQHVVNGGLTDEDNLIALCGRHHHHVHELGWTIQGDADKLQFTRPDGTPLDTFSEPLHPDIRSQLKRMVQKRLPEPPPLFDTG